MKSSCWILGLVATTLVLTGCPEKRRPSGGASMQKAVTPAPAKAEPETKSTAVGPLAEYGKNLSNAEKTAAQVTGLTTLTQAVKQFEVMEGRYPRNLDELIVGRYFAKLPVPPRGKRFLYDAKTGKVDVESLPEAAAEAAPAPAVVPAPVSEAPVAPAPTPEAIAVP
ncbi:MAG: hypothetical protein IPL39_06830 [Opitutaceae bacterium]|nr:hypothetical protein [Opitutaceae bacterium]